MGFPIDITINYNKEPSNVTINNMPLVPSELHDNGGGWYNVRIKLSDKVPTRYGYTFNKWRSDSNIYYSAGGYYTTELQVESTYYDEISMYTTWTANTYTVSFDANGGTVNTTSKKVTFGSKYGTLPIPTRTNYNFDGWYTLISGGTKITEDTSLWSASSHILYAHWNAKTCTVTFDANATGVTPDPTSKTVTYNSTYGTLANATRTGYALNGWYTSKTGGTKITSSTTVTSSTNHTLYALWKNTTTYNIKYYNNGASSASYTDTKAHDVDIKLRDKTFTKTGYEQSGWSTTDGGSKTNSLGATYKTNAALNLYPTWTANKYTVSFDANGGTVSTTSKTVTFDSTYGTLPTPTRENYYCDGWYTSKTGGTKITSSTTVTTSANNLTLYAHWSYDKLGAPTTVNFSPNIVTPTNGSLTISWSGAKNCSTKNINNYLIYYKVGSAPTINDNDGHKAVSVTSGATSGSTTLDLSGATEKRGQQIYVIIKSRNSTTSSDDKYWSDWKSANGSLINRRPSAPTVNTNKNRLKSTGATSVKYTVTTGTDGDSSQTLSVYYSTDGGTTKIKMTSGSITLSPDPSGSGLSSIYSVNFYTYDGLEYSSATTKTLYRLSALRITNINMVALRTYVSKRITVTGGRNYVKEITGSCTANAGSADQVTGSIVSYKWYLAIFSGANRTDFTITPTYKLITTTDNNTLLKTNVTTITGMDYDRSYKLAVKVVDDIGEESAYAYSDNIFCIPQIPSTLDHFNKKGSDTNVSGTNSSHFNNYIRVKVGNDTGWDKAIIHCYENSDRTQEVKNISFTNNTINDFNFSTLTRGKTYYFCIEYKTGNLSKKTSNFSYTRALDLGKKAAITVPSNKIDGFSTSTVTINLYTPLLIALDNNNDVSETTSDVFKLKINNLLLAINSYESYTSANGINIKIIPDNLAWTTIMSGKTLNNIYTKTPLILEIYDNFGNIFTVELKISLDFRNNFECEALTPSDFLIYCADSNSGTTRSEYASNLARKSSYSYLLIAESEFNSTTTYYTCSYKQIPTVSPYDLFQNQKLKIKIRLNSKITQKLTFVIFVDGKNNFNKQMTRTVNSNSTNNLEFVFEVPKIEYYVLAPIKIKVSHAYSNNPVLLSTTTVNFNRTVPSKIDYKITKIDRNGDNFTFYFEAKDFGGAGGTASARTSKYSEIRAPIYWLNNNTLYVFKKFGTNNDNIIYDGTSWINDFKVENNVLTGNITLEFDSSHGDLGEKVPIAPAVGVVNYYYAIDTNYLPVGERTFWRNAQYSIANFSFIYYNAIPNLAYGKNFFLINTTDNGNHKDLVLIVRPINYMDGSTSRTRNKVYFGANSGSETYFEISGDDLIIDCGEW